MSTPFGPSDDELTDTRDDGPADGYLLRNELSLRV
jgi:hypothetical protein